jgi:large subunit ribosomal protein L31
MPKEGIHPQWYPEAKVTCACGATWTTGATVPEIRTDICSTCHPFYTGEMRIVDTEGQVDRFMKRLEARDKIRRDAEEREAERISPELPISDLKLSARINRTLKEAEVEQIGDLLSLLAQGDNALLDLHGFGRQALADVKKVLRARGYEWEEEAEPA